MMRNSCPWDEDPTCVVDIDFEAEEHDREDWAARVLQRAWAAWRQRMGMLLLLYGVTHGGSDSLRCASLGRVRCSDDLVCVQGLWLPALAALPGTVPFCLWGHVWRGLGSIHVRTIEPQGGTWMVTSWVECRQRAQKLAARTRDAVARVYDPTTALAAADQEDARAASSEHMLQPSDSLSAALARALRMKTVQSIACRIAEQLSLGPMRPAAQYSGWRVA